MSEPKRKVTHIGAPACFALEQVCKQVREAFSDPDEYVGMFVVGSCLERADWRDVDVRMMMSDKAFARLFPNAILDHGAAWEFDPRWILLTVSISKWMSEQTGLPIDFQFQTMTYANEKHKGRRHSVGLRYVTGPTPLPKTRERVEMPAAEIGFTLNQEPEPPKAPTFAEQIPLK